MYDPACVSMCVRFLISTSILTANEDRHFYSHSRKLKLRVKNWFGHMRSICQRRNTTLSLENRLIYVKSVSQSSPVILFFLFFRSCLDFKEHAMLHLIQITVSVNWRSGSKWKPRILIGIWGSFANQYSFTYPHRKS